jgi:diguanylate cyclase (GGDEF)-like protein
VRYAYRLDGYDERWRDGGSSTTLTYTNLPAGQYRLNVRCSNADGRPGSQVARLAFTVAPPWWQRWWVRSLGVLALAALAYGAVSLRLRRVKGQRDLLQREVEARTRELAHLATIDPLTELYNRRHFIDVGERELRRAHRYGRPLTLLMLDLDHFKRINDTFGHAAGDRVLRRAAAAWSRTLREADLIGRVGGEEFAVILPEIGCDEAAAVAERLQSALVGLELGSEAGDIVVSASIGVAALAPEEDLDGLLSRADAALYEAKNAGRNSIRIAAQ